MAEYKAKLLTMNDNKTMPRTYSKTITNQAVSTAWGSGYASATIEVPVSEDATNKSVMISFIPSSAAVAIPVVAAVASDKVTVQLLRFSSGSVSGDIQVLISD